MRQLPPTPAPTPPPRLVRSEANPVISVAGNPFETISQYVPAPVRLPDGSLTVYVKGDSTGQLWAWRSPAPDQPLSLAGKALDKGAPGEWDSAYVVDPVAVYDAPSDTIHIWYKGTATTGGGMAARWSWGHATAPGSDPLQVTKDPANPILTSEAVEAALNVSGVTDNMLADVIRVGSSFYFYGHYFNEGTLKLFLSKGTTWNDPVPQATILQPSQGLDLVQCPSVYRLPGQSHYTMVYTEGEVNPKGKRVLKLAWSPDGQVWQPGSRTLLEPDEAQEWESLRVYGASVLKKGSGDYAEPELIDDRLMVFYSGSNKVSSGFSLDQTGMFFLLPRRMGPAETV